jgi:ATP-dependent Clp protease, protease subunit
MIRLSERAQAQWSKCAPAARGVQARKRDDVTEIAIYGAIGDDLFGDGVRAESVAAAIPERAPVARVVINSPGGDPFEAIAIGSLLQMRADRVIVRVEGLAASAASLLACYGHEIEMTTGSMLMIHSPWTIAMGDAPTLLEAASQLEQIGDQMVRIYGARMGEDAARAAMAGETWYGTDEASAAKLCDCVVDNVPRKDPGEDARAARMLRARDLAFRAKFNLPLTGSL